MWALQNMSEIQSTTNKSQTWHVKYYEKHKLNITQKKVKIQRLWPKITWHKLILLLRHKICLIRLIKQEEILEWLKLKGTNFHEELNKAELLEQWMFHKPQFLMFEVDKVT